MPGGTVCQAVSWRVHLMNEPDWSMIFWWRFDAISLFISWSRRDLCLPSSGHLVELLMQCFLSVQHWVYWKYVDFYSSTGQRNPFKSFWKVFQSFKCPIYFSTWLFWKKKSFQCKVTIIPRSWKHAQTNSWIWNCCSDFYWWHPLHLCTTCTFFEVHIRILIQNGVSTRINLVYFIWIIPIRKNVTFVRK